MILKQYFQAYNNYFWQWEEEGNVIAVPNGNTIAYWPRVKAILDKIHLQGLPRFGPFLLALAATSNNGAETIKGAVDTIRRRVEDERQKPELKSAEAFLNLLASLPKEYKSEHLQIRLLLTIFRASHNGLGFKNSQTILVQIKLDDPKQRRSFNKLPLSSATLKRDLKTLALLGEKYPSTNSILEAMLDLPEVEEVELESELPPNKARKDLIDELLEHPQNFYGRCLSETNLEWY